MMQSGETPQPDPDRPTGIDWFSIIVILVVIAAVVGFAFYMHSRSTPL